MVEVFPQHHAEAERWVDFGMLLHQSARPLFLSLGVVLVFPSVIQITILDAEINLNLSKNCQRSCSFRRQLIALVCHFC